MYQVLRDEDDRVTLESTGATFWINYTELKELSQIEPLPDEAEYYEELHDEIVKVTCSHPRVSRRVLVTDHRCISLIQVLRGRARDIMMVAMRSADTAKLPSDLGFIAREAISLGVDRVVVSIGSLHTVLR